MKHTLTISFLLLTLWVGCNKAPVVTQEDELEKSDPVAVTKSNPMKLWMHYMPWFEDKTTTDNGKWGQHWTMATKNPDLTDKNGRRQIAAHYYPLIGPYASSDKNVLEYHFLLMKYAGVDGILIDWYGTRDLYDYPANLRNTEVITSVLEKVGLEYAIVYEDRTLSDELPDDSERISQAIRDMQYLQKNNFNRPNYIKIDGKPLLMIFGPQVLKQPADWHAVFSPLSPKPVFLTLYGHSSGANNARYTNSQGEYIWVDAADMETKYRQKDHFDIFIGAAYPGFNDFYQEGGWGESVLHDIDHKDGALLKQLLRMAKDNRMNQLQLITWNDFGEGTMIEPTEEFQYTFLEIIQEFAGVDYKKAHLEAIFDYYTLKEKFKTDTEKSRQINQAFYYLISLQDSRAIELLNRLK